MRFRRATWILPSGRNQQGRKRDRWTCIQDQPTVTLPKKRAQEEIKGSERVWGGGGGGDEERKQMKTEYSGRI